jgi:hypothetical protein
MFRTAPHSPILSAIDPPFPLSEGLSLNPFPLPAREGVGVRFLATSKLKTISDGTKLPMVVELLKTTTYGMKPDIASLAGAKS